MSSGNSISAGSGIDSTSDGSAVDPPASRTHAKIQTATKIKPTSTIFDFDGDDLICSVKLFTLLFTSSNFGFKESTKSFRHGKDSFIEGMADFSTVSLFSFFSPGLDSEAVSCSFVSVLSSVSVGVVAPALSSVADGSVASVLSSVAAVFVASALTSVVVGSTASALSSVVAGSVAPALSPTASVVVLSSVSSTSGRDTPVSRSMTTTLGSARIGAACSAVFFPSYPSGTARITSFVAQKSLMREVNAISSPSFVQTPAYFIFLVISSPAECGI
mmetsp:Transcript_26687/g.35556  ORF Transcript_26687/g.35556 Transcript_26687/m.35556 type:complete len:274 (-) Transcript_26687:31-852(-)